MFYFEVFGEFCAPLEEGFCDAVWTEWVSDVFATGEAVGMLGHLVSGLQFASLVVCSLFVVLRGV